jgi:tRNA(Ile)-lysidine synthase
MAQFIKTIQNFAFKNELWQSNSKIIVGVSGGPDSVCLLDVFNALSKKYELKLHIAHVNYGLRDKDSDNDEKFVRKLAEKYGIGLSVLNPEKSLYQGNLESSLRNIRYDFFEEVRKNLNYDLIAVAHNQDDQAETVLMRILRGSGLNGLSSMKAKSGRLIRPLLETSKQDILAYLKEKGLEFCIDRTNLQSDFLRNRIRNELLPLLEKEYNPSIKKTIANWSLSVADDYEYIDAAAKKLLKKIANKSKKGTFSFSSEIFLKNHPSMQRQVIRKIMENEFEIFFDVESSHIEEMIKIIKSSKRKSQEKNFLGLNISKKGDKITLFR